jgi:hypothetical protein
MAKYSIPAAAVFGVTLIVLDAMGRHPGAMLIGGCILLGSALIASSKRA